MPFVPDEVARFNTGVTKVVPVIASFDSKGNIRPIHVRINSNVYKILSCISRDYGPLTIFTCTVNNCGMQREVNLTYHPQERCWTMNI